MEHAVRSLTTYQDDVKNCVRCHDRDLLHAEPWRARPLVCKSTRSTLGVVIVAEAPNRDDTYQPDKGYLTYDHDTDPTCVLLRDMLRTEVGLTASQIDSVIYTNSVLCLPRGRGGRFPVTAVQARECRPWLERLLEDAGARVVVTLGAKALHALGRIRRHSLRLRRDRGQAHAWHGRTLVPLYHPSALGRISRSEAEQRADIRVLRGLLSAPPAGSASTQPSRLI